MSNRRLQTRREINAAILRLSVPAVLSNIALPLLGLCDTFITGHLGAEVYLAAIAVGTIMVNSTYWLFGFLRAGTSGLTAEAFGGADARLQRNILTLSMVIALAIGLAIIALGRPISALLLLFVDAPEATASLARDYFLISTLSAPALLATMSVGGWMIGKQNTVYPMAIAIGVNVLNIALSFTLVYGFDCGFKGVAWGTMCANWVGLFGALALARKLGGGRLLAAPGQLRGAVDVKRFFAVNTELLLRSACILAVTYGMTAFASRLGGDGALAVNAVLMQLFLFFSFFMDGFAYAAEAMCGRWKGAGNRLMLDKSVRWLAVWSAGTSVVFAAVYFAGAGWIAGLLTDVADVVTAVGGMAVVCAAIPLCSGGAFLMDGVYIGLTQTRKMLIATFAAATVFYVGAWAVFHFAPGGGYMLLWCAFLAFLLCRSVVLSAWLRLYCGEQALL